MIVALLAALAIGQPPCGPVSPLGSRKADLIAGLSTFRTAPAIAPGSRERPAVRRTPIELIESSSEEEQTDPSLDPDPRAMTAPRRFPRPTPSRQASRADQLARPNISRTPVPRC
jgi:hypothetical protein